MPGVTFFCVCVRPETNRQGVVGRGLKDYGGEIIQGTFYEAELQKVVKAEDAIYRIEKVLRKRKKNGETQHLVRWQGYSKDFDSWVDDIKSVS